jgi:simple sugar transport system permease protein
MNKIIKAMFSPLLAPVISITLALVVASIAIMYVGENPFEVYAIMFNGAFGSTFYLFATLTRATPIIITGLCAAIAWKSGYISIGGEGQMIMGGFASAIVALYTPGPVMFRVLLALVAALVVGALYCWIATVLFDKLNVNLPIATLMLNFSAAYITMHFTSNVFLDSDTPGMRIIQTFQLAPQMRISRFIEAQTFHYGFIFAVFLVFLVWFMMSRTNFGYEARMTGYNFNFSKYGGVNSRKTMYMMLGISGAIAAFAGFVEVFGVSYRYVHDNFTLAGFAWVGLSAALISRFHPLGVLFTSIILAGIQTGGGAVARATPIPVEISSIVHGCVVLFISAQIIIDFKGKKKAASQEPADDEPESLAQTGEGGESS